MHLLSGVPRGDEGEPLSELRRGARAAAAAPGKEPRQLAGIDGPGLQARRVRSRGMKPEIALLLEFMDQAFKGPAWHGTSLWGSLRGVTAEEALRRPAVGRHNVWELALHAAYWKCIVRRRLTRDEELSFSRSP